MPQMAPMMWQTIYLSCIALMVVIMGKNFFSVNSAQLKTNKVSVMKSEKAWSW